MAAIAKLIERIEFAKYLIVRLGARRAAIELDDVAELAGERTAARELHADVEIMLEFQEIEARHRRLGHVDLEFLGDEQALAGALLPGLDELRDDILDFAKDAEIRASRSDAGSMLHRGRRSPPEVRARGTSR